MVRVLLSKGADPRDADADDMADHLNVTMRYWLRMAKAHPYYPGDHALPTADSVLIKATRRLQPCNLHRIPELWFGILGQRYAAHEMFPRFVGHLTSNPGEPLVVLMPGPPGHGKTFSADTAALNIVQTKADIKSISCSQIKGDADLFGRAGEGGSTSTRLWHTTMIHKAQGDILVDISKRCNPEVSNMAMFRGLVGTDVATLQIPVQIYCIK